MRHRYSLCACVAVVTRTGTCPVQYGYSTVIQVRFDLHVKLNINNVALKKNGVYEKKFGKGSEPTVYTASTVAPECFFI